MNVLFSVNMHDSDGDVTDKCILIHIKDNVILRFNDIAEYDDFVNQLNSIRNEIKRTCGKV